MIDESQTIDDEAVVTAPDPEATAAPEIEVIQPDGDETKPKTFTQEELDDAIARRLAKAERKWRREQAPPQPEIPANDAQQDDDAETRPLTPQEIIQQHEARKQQQTLLTEYEDREEAALEKYDDFEQVAKNPELPVTGFMAQAIMASDIGPDVLYHLGSNPKDAARIAKLPPLLQAKEIGKIEATLTSNPPVKKTSSAPAPITPVTAHTRGAPVFDTNDPRSTKAMSTSEWIEADRRRRIKEMEARR